MPRFSPEEKTQLLHTLESFLDYDLRQEAVREELKHTKELFDSQIEVVSTTQPVGKHGTKVTTTRRIKDPEQFRKDLAELRKSNLVMKVFS